MLPVKLYQPLSLYPTHRRRRHPDLYHVVTSALQLRSRGSWDARMEISGCQTQVCYWWEGVQQFPSNANRQRERLKWWVRREQFQSSIFSAAAAFLGSVRAFRGGRIFHRALFCHVWNGKSVGDVFDDGRCYFVPGCNFPPGA